MEKILQAKLFYFKYLIIVLLAITTIAVSFFFKPQIVQAITLQELAGNISKLSSDEQALLEEVIGAETQIEQKTQEIVSYQQQLDNFEVELKDLYAKTSEIEKNMNAIKEKIQSNAIKSYKYNNDNIARLLIGAKNLNEVATVIYIYRHIIRENNSLIEDFKSEKKRYEMAYRESEDSKSKISTLKENIIKEKDTLSVYLKEKQDLLAKVKGEKSQFTTVLAQIKERIRQIQPPGLILTGEWDMVATAYFSGGGGLNGNGITAIGLQTKKGIVAVDPKVIPLGTRLYIPGYGEALAADTGGWVKGNRIDLVFDSLEDCYRYGRRKIKVYLVQK
jgi:3D (Asp-Asp-Asp) domain-containing protein/peptidoglycan hydrolase CwlO-like protein